jgi:2-(1,2-epoxy-1,2-dihydrophenyl)acetyl-CoA isomerase
LKYTYLKIQKDWLPKVMLVKLDDQKRRNALSTEMIAELLHLFAVLRDQSSIRLLIISHEGKNFCSGGDVKAMQEQGEMFSGSAIELMRNYQRQIQQIPKAMRELPMPVMAVLDGGAVGAGVDFSCMADLRLGSEEAFFKESFARLNLVPGDGGTYFLPLVVGYSMAMDMLLTGRTVGANEAKERGLLNYQFARDQLWDEVKKLAATILENAPISLELIKKAMRSNLPPLDSHLDLLASFQAIAQRSSQHTEGLNSLLEKRRPEYQDE